MIFLANNFDGMGGFLGGILGIITFFLLIALLKGLIRVTLPHRLLVVTGRKRVKDWKTFGFSVERGRTMVWPYFQSVDKLELRILPINVRVETVNSANGITVGADATACVCIDDDNENMVYSAVERLMGKDIDQIQEQVRQTLIGNFRGALNKATPLQAIGMQESLDLTDLEHETNVAPGEGERAQFRNALLEDINSDISSFGMKVVSVSLQKIWDTSSYIANLAQRTLANKRQQVEIEEAKLRAQAEQAESDAKRRVDVAKSKADELIIAAREKLSVYQQESDAMVHKAKLEADSRISEAQNIGQREVEQLNVALKKLKNQSEILIEEMAKQKAAKILSEGEEEAAKIKEAAKNKILKQKVELLHKTKGTGNAIIFIQQQLPHLFEEYRKHARDFRVDSLLVMDNEKGFNGAVNRGPEAFGNFLHHFENALGISIKDFVTVKSNGGN